MTGVALKGLAGRKLRALLTAFAIVIGVSMVSGTFILTDTMQKSFDGIFSQSYSDTDAVVKGKEIVKGSTSGSAATVPASLLADVRALPEVESAGGSLDGREGLDLLEQRGVDGGAATGGELDELLAVDDGVGALVGLREDAVERFLHRVGEHERAAHHRHADDHREGGE